MCGALRGWEMARQRGAGRRLVLDVTTRRGVRLETFVRNGLTTYLTGPVASVLQPSESLLDVAQIGLDLLEQTEVPAPVVRLGARIGGMLIDHVEIGKVITVGGPVGAFAA